MGAEQSAEQHEPETAATGPDAVTWAQTFTVTLADASLKDGAAALANADEDATAKGGGGQQRAGARPALAGGATAEDEDELSVATTRSTEKALSFRLAKQKKSTRCGVAMKSTHGVEGVSPVAAGGVASDGEGRVEEAVLGHLRSKVYSE